MIQPGPATIPDEPLPAVGQLVAPVLPGPLVAEPGAVVGRPGVPLVEALFAQVETLLPCVGPSLLGVAVARAVR